MVLDLSTMEKASAYQLLTQVVIPRPVAWVLSSDSRHYNLAPFSFFSMVCSDPPVIMLSIGASKPDGSAKDTYTNIMETKQFVIHIAAAEQANEVTQSSASLAHGKSELEFCGLETAEFEGFSLPRVIGPKIALACTLYQHQEIGNSPQHLVFGQIEKVWLDESVIGKDSQGRLKVAAEAVDPIARLGSLEYATFGEILSIPRPS